MKLKYQAYGCPIRYSLGIFGDKWSLLVIRDLVFKKRKHYGEFLMAGEGISTNILADRLQELEANGIISKSRDPLHGKKFIYQLSQKGLDLIPVLLSLIDWAEKYDDATEVSKDFVEQIRSNPKALRSKLLAELVRTIAQSSALIKPKHKRTQ